MMSITDIYDNSQNFLRKLTAITAILYRGAGKSLARPTSRCIFLMVRKFHLMLVLLYT